MEEDAIGHSRDVVNRFCQACGVSVAWLGSLMTLGTADLQSFTSTLIKCFPWRVQWLGISQSPRQRLHSVPNEIRPEPGPRKPGSSN